MGRDSFARLSERNKVKVGKILRGAFIVSFCLCFFVACYLVIQVWHWPGWLAYVAVPILSGLVWLGLAAGSCLGLAYLSDASQRANREAGPHERPHRDIL